MREIVLDIETTGLNVKDGHRIVEIGCVELYNYLPTGKIYQVYINPQRDMPLEAYNIHGLSEDFLQNHNVFKDHVSEFLNFIKKDTLIIHNAIFDLTFLNFELKKLNYKEISFSRVKDTMKIARKKFPRTSVSLDALCRRFRINNSKRNKHGALLDSQILASVYLELIGGRQQFLSLDIQDNLSDTIDLSPVIKKIRTRRFTDKICSKEKNAHDLLIKKLKNPIWNKKT